MLDNQPSLADQAARLRTAILAEEAPCWLPDALFARIMAALARVFARLEDMIRLWQSGLLSPPPAPRAHAPRTHAARRARATPAIRRRATPMPANPDPDSVTSPVFIPARPASNGTARAIRPTPASPHRRQVRALPCPCAKKPLPRGSRHRVYFITISK